MACLRSISKRVNLFSRRCHPSCSHLVGSDKEDTKSSSPNSGLMIHRVLPHALTDSLGALFRRRQYAFLALPVDSGFSSCRYMSSTPSEWSDKVDGMGFVTEEVIPDKTIDAVASQLPAIDEVAAAASDSFFPVAALQYFIDGVHSFTGLNWWSSIVLTTLILRGLTVPLLINQLKAASRLNMLRPRLEELRQEISNRGMDPEAMEEGKKRMQALFNEYGVTPLTPLKGALIQGPIFVSFFFALRNMAEKVPSFNSGGTLWFTDLTIPDSSYILPVLTLLTFLIVVEWNMEGGLEGNPVAGNMKKFSRILVVLSVPVIINFEQALFCYWLTSNLFSLAYGVVIRRPEVKRLLNLPDDPVSPTEPSQSTSTPFSFSQFKRETAVQDKPLASSEPSNVSERRISRASVLIQRIRTLEKQLKDRRSKK